MPPSEGTDPLLCTIEIVHNIGQVTGSAANTPRAETNPFTHLSEVAKPKLDSLLCRRLLQHQHASLRIDVQPSSPLGSGLPRRAYELSVLLPRGQPIIEPAALSEEEEAVRQPFPTVRLAREPTLPELAEFADSLRGKKATLHANLSSVFARHLTSYLGAWGVDISHIPIDEGVAAARETGTFIIIDDDVAVLKRELLRVRADRPLKPRLTKRPSMSSRTQSSPLVRPPQRRPTVVIHFTSLTNYNQVRDVVINYLGVPSESGPEIMVIPKPVGPRRFLTALHTAINRPIVDPFFSPIATSPRSPGGYHSGSRTPVHELTGFFDSVAEEVELPMETKARSPLGEYPPSAATVVRTVSGLHLALPTPTPGIVATPAMEYFTSANKTNGANVAGVVMQSPDGRPFGMFFEPPSNSRKSVNTVDRRKSSSRQSSEVVEDSSPQSRRLSSMSTATTKPVIARSNSRRKTLPGATSEPIVAQGRDRSSTVTQRRRTPLSSPVIVKDPKKTKEVVVPPINVLIVEGAYLANTLTHR
jgi:osomolarity two-component system response regulator SSK1